MGPREEQRAAERGILRAMGVGEYQGRQVQGSCDPPPSEGLLVGKGQSDSILKAILRGKKAIWGAVSQVSCFSFFSVFTF